MTERMIKPYVLQPIVFIYFNMLYCSCRHRRMQQQSMHEWSNLYWRCQFVHMCLRRGLHWNTLRDRWEFGIGKHFDNLSPFFLTMCPSHFIRLLTIFPTIQALVPTSCIRSFILLFSNLFTSAIPLYYCSRKLVLLCCCSSIRTELTFPSQLY